MTVVRIVADDLTGALDAAAPLVGVAGPLPVLWDAQAALKAGGSFVLDSEIPGRAGAAAVVRCSGGADLAYKKIDSLLRGRTVDEIAACLESGAFASAVIAPAFPAQHRITRGGRQYWRPTAATAWLPVEVDLMAELRRRGLPVRHAHRRRMSSEAGFSYATPAAMMTSGPSFAPGELSMDHSCGSARRAWRGRSPDRPRRRRRSACARRCCW